MRIFLLAMGTVLALLSACSPGLDRASDCKGWGTVSFWQTATLEMVAPCLEAGADPEVRQGVHGWTPLHLAAAYNPNPVVIARLVTAGADPNAKEIYGGTPLHGAAAHNPNPAVIEALLAVGADPKATENSGETPLHRAARNNNPGVINALLKAGADIQARDRFSETPLHEAAAHTTTPAVIVALLQAGADPNAKSKDNQRPWDYAENNEAIKNSAPFWRLKAQGL